MKTRAFTISIALVVLCYGCKDDSRYHVVDNIRQAAKLATTETIVDKIVFGTSDKKILGVIRLNEAQFAAYSTAVITTGIDLDKLRPEDIRIHDKRIELKLPPIQVINFSYPFSSFRIDESITVNRLLNHIDIFDRENFYRQAETDIRDNLPFMGVAGATRDKTRQLLYPILKQSGYEEIFITFRTGILDISDNETAAPDNVNSISNSNEKQP
jgi:hypothetical protein